MRLRTRDLKLSAVLLLGALAVGCTSVEQLPGSRWEVKPLYRLSHGGAGAMALGRVYEGQGRWHDAAQAYRLAAEEAPGNALAHGALGRALSAQHRHAEAVVALRRAAELEPARARWLNDLGYALMLDGRLEQARQVLQQALQLDPDHGRARHNLASLESRAAASHPTVATAVTLPAPALQEAPAAGPRLLTEPTRPPLQVVTEPGPAPVAAAAWTARPLPALPDAARPPAPLPPARIEIANGNGVTGAAARLWGLLQQSGHARGRLKNLRPYVSVRSVVEYRSGYEAQAGDIARHLPVAPEMVPLPAANPHVDVRVVLGRDAVSRTLACAAPGTCSTDPARM